MSDHASEPILRHVDPSEGFDPGEPKSGTIWGFAIGSVLILVLVIFALQQYFDKVWGDLVYEKVLAPPSEQLQTVRHRDEWDLTHYMYLDKSKGQIRIPVEEARQLFLKEAAEGKLFYPAKATLPKKEEPEAPPPPPSTDPKP